MTEPVNILHPSIAEMLHTLGAILQRQQIDYYLVGAMARDVQLAVNKELQPRRGTNDVDIAILLDREEQYYTLQDALLRTGYFEISEIKPFKFYYKKAIELDILPFGEIENDERRFELNRYTLLSMDMTGFKEVYPFTDSISVADGLTLNVCTLEGLIVLKLIANNDDGSRTKDITDIEHILDVYFEFCFKEIFTDFTTVAEMYSTDNPVYPQLVAARVLGRKMKQMLLTYPDTEVKLKTILAKKPVATWQAMLDGFNDSFY